MQMQKPIPFLVPRTLTWDKLCALFIYVRYYLPDVKPWSFSELIEAGEVQIYFEDQGDIPAEVLDVDVRKKYPRGSSATRIAADLTGLKLAGLWWLSDLLNRNNATGFLKSDQHSLVYLIRAMFNVGTENPSRERRISVIDLMWPAVEIYFRASSNNEAAVAEIPNPFTLAGQKQLVSMCPGLNAVPTVQAIRERWNESFEACRRKRGEAQEWAAELKPELEFDVPVVGGGQAKGHVIRSDNTRIASEYFKREDLTHVVVLIVVRRSGNAAIFCRGAQSLGKLYNALSAREAERWYLETRNPSPFVLNGSTTRAVEPTSLSARELVGIVCENYQHRSQSHQA